MNAYLDGAPEAAPFYAGRFDDPAAFVDKAAEVEGRFDASTRARALAALEPAAHPATVSAREAWAERGGYMVTTGQQPGLFGGPLYSLYKALTAIALARALEGALGRPVLPVYWIASEDHDWAEADHTWLIDRDNELVRIEVADPGAGGRPLHRVRLGGGIEQALDRFLDALPASDFAGDLETLLREAYAAGCTLPGGFTAVLRALLEPLGLHFIDAAHPELKQASLPLLFEELDRAAELEAVLAGTARELSAAGFDTQVHLPEAGVNLFLEGPAGRDRLYRDGDGFSLHNAGVRLSRADIEARVSEDPLVLSPNVLLRPVVESTVLPTLAYVAGPGEMAYFGQLRAYFEAFGMRPPIVHPRHAAVVVEAKVGKVLAKFGVEVEALAQPFHELASQIAREETPDDVREALGGLRAAAGQGTGALLAAARRIDPTLKGPVGHARAQIFHALEEVEKKIVHALKRENEIALAQLEKARLHLYPEGRPQERMLNPFYYLFRYGNPFVGRLVEAFTVEPGPGEG